MKKLGVVAVAGLMAASFSVGVLGQSAIVKITADYRTDVSVVLDGKLLELKSATDMTIYPIMYNGTTYLPVRAVGEAVGKKVSWDDAAKTVTLGKPAAADTKSTDDISGSVKPYLTRYEAIKAEIESTEVPALHAEKLNLFKAFTNQIDSLQKELKNLQDDFDYYHKQGELTSTEYIKQDGDAQKVLNNLDDLEKALQSKYNMG